MEWVLVSQIKEGGEAARRAKRGVRQGVVRSAEVVACTLSSAGGDLLGLVKGLGSDPSMLFNAIMIDEVCCFDSADHLNSTFMFVLIMPGSTRGKESSSCCCFCGAVLNPSCILSLL